MHLPRILLAGALALIAAALPAAASRQPVALIFDTDMGNDVDDALALGMIHALQSRGACRLLAVTLTNPDPLAGKFVDVVNTFYGRDDIPIGVSPDAPLVSPSKFLALAETRESGGQARFPSKFAAATAPRSVALLRRTLAAVADGGVVIVQVGFFTNLAALLESPPDAASPLTGRELVARKVALLSVMGGAFQSVNSHNHFLEFNVRTAVPAAQRVADGWPTPIVWSGFEVGVAIPFPAAAIDRDFAWTDHHPVSEAYQLYLPTPHERPTWDLTSVVHAICADRGYFSLSAPGRVVVEADGFTRFTPAKDGRDRFLIVNDGQAARLRGLFAAWCSEPPATR